MSDMKLVCVVCGFESTDADAFMTHMLATGHALPDELRRDLADGGGVAELVSMLAAVQRDPLKHGTRVPDDQVPPEVREALERAEAMARARGEAETIADAWTGVSPGEEIPFGTLRHPDGGYQVDVVVFAGEPRGELRLRRSEDDTAVCATHAIGLDEIAAIEADRVDLIEPMLDALIRDAERKPS